MAKDPRSDGQLSFDLETNSNASKLRSPSCIASLPPAKELHLKLVVCNSGVRSHLAPNSDEVTRLLLEQAKGLRW